MIFLVELNQMEAWGTNISSAYLKAFTKENCSSRLVLSLETRKGTSY